MADAVARQRYADDVKPVELKQRIQETPVAHPERVEARSEVREATERRDDDHGDHGGAKIIGEEEPATAVIKMSKQQHSKSDHKTAKVPLQSMVSNDRAQLTLFYIDVRNSGNCSSKKSSDFQVASSSEC